MEYGCTVMINASPLENPSISLRDPAVWQGVFGGGSTDSGVAVTPSSAMGYPPLWRALNLISGDVAKLPLNIYRRQLDGGKEPAKSHPAYAMLRRKASDTTKSFTLKRTLTHHALIRGNGYAAIARNNRREPSELLLLTPSETFPALVNGDLWYVTQVGTEQMRLPARDVFHIRGLSNDGLAGYDVVTLMADALGVGMAAQRFGARFFGEGTNTSGVLMVPGHFSEEKIRNTMAAWGEMNAGLKNSHKIALLQDGAKYQQTQISPDQAQFLETRQYEIRATVANITGCPGHKLGDDTRTSHSSLEQENQSYLDDCLDTWLCEWESEVNDKLLSDTEKANDTHFAEFNRKALLRMSSTDRANYYSRLQEHGDMTVNDVLRAESMPTIGDKGDRRYRPANLMEIGEQSDEQQGGDAMPNNNEEPPQQQATATLRAMISTSVTKALTIEHERVVKAAKNEANFIGWMDTFYDEWLAHSDMPADGAREALVGHVASSKGQLLEVAGCATKDTLVSAVIDCVATWSERGTTVTDQIMKGLSDGRN